VSARDLLVVLEVAVVAAAPGLVFLVAWLIFGRGRDL
jgi:hypothetical protein